MYNLQTCTFDFFPLFFSSSNFTIAVTHILYFIYYMLQFKYMVIILIEIKRKEKKRRRMAWRLYRSSTYIYTSELRRLLVGVGIGLIFG